MTNRIDTTLDELKQSGAKALVPFITVGFPDVEMSESLAEGILNSGADMLELGIPFSDPVAEGPTVQMTSFKALENGANLQTGIQTVRNLRNKGIQAPLIFMGYLNPYLHYGLEKFAQEAQEAGLDGMIIPDLPSDEAAPYQEVLEKYNIYLIPLLAPTSTEQRIAQACKQAKGFIYCVSVTGVTSARDELATGVSDLVHNIRKQTDLPLLVGFGGHSHQHRAANCPGLQTGQGLYILR